MPVTSVRAAVVVAEFDVVLGWYGRFLGRPADSVPMAGLAEWDVTGSGRISLFHDPDHAGTSQVTLIVDDLDQQIADLKGRGLAAAAISTGDYARFAAITDPEGNTIT